MTIYDDKNQSSFIIDGKEIKSINQYFNKNISIEKSNLENKNKKKSSNKIKRMYIKRSNILNDRMHKISKALIDYCVEKNIGNICIGYNKEWKQNVSLGKINNQNFVQIPYNQLIGYIKNKGEEHNITLKLHEESYTSKASSLSNDPLIASNTFSGQRIHRGLYKDNSINKTINADLNSAINILKKCNSKSVKIGSNGFMINPLRYTYKENSYKFL